MAQFPESKLLARAVRRHATGAVAALGQKVVKGQIVDTATLAIELLGADVTVERDHLLLGSWLRYFDRRYGLSEGDTVLMTRLTDGDWFVFDVLSQEDFDLGDRPDEGTTDPYNTGSGQVVAEVPYYDQDGVQIGVMLLFDPATLRNFLGHTTAAGTGAPVVPNP